MEYEVFYQTYHKKIERYLIGKGVGFDDAQELTQEIFSYCYTSFSQYDEKKGSISTWLYLRVNSRYKNYLRKKSNTPFFEDVQGEEIQIADDFNMDSLMYIQDMRQLLAEALKTLPDIERQIVILRYFGGFSTAQVAQKLQLREGNVRTKLSRTLKKLEIYLTNRQ